MINSLVSLRVNLAIVFLGCAFLTLLIKLTSLLPNRYYFSFSRMVVGREGPFLVDTPRVTGRQLCEILRRNKLDTSDLGATQINCSLNADERIYEADRGGSRITPEERSVLHEIAATQDARVRQAVAAAMAKQSISHMGDKELRRSAIEATSVDGILQSLKWHYSLQVGSHIGSALREFYESIAADKIASPISNSQSEYIEEPPVERSKLTAMQIASVLKANLGLVETMSRQSLQLKPISRSVIDKAIAKFPSPDTVAQEIADYYADQISDSYERLIIASFSAQGLEIDKKSSVRARILFQINREGMTDYVIASLLRAAPVLLFGIVMGFIFGHAESNSISAAALLTALLACWPLIIAWEQMVNYRWQEHRAAFTAFYVLYIIAFALLGRMGALMGAWLQQAKGGGAATHPMEIVGLTEVIGTTVAGIGINTFLYIVASWLPILAE